MATTIKVDGTDATFTWQDDQSLSPATDVDYFVKAKNLDYAYVPLSTFGKAADKDPEQTTLGAKGQQIPWKHVYE